MKINVVYNNKIAGYSSILEVLENTLLQKSVEFQTFDIDNMKNFGGFTFVIGGDGTLLKAARFYAAAKTPVLGINLGRLGFLSQAGIEEIDDVVSKVLDGKYSTEERLMLESENALALNDFVIKGCNTYRASKFYLEINGRFVCDYIADGLSAGGPVLYPTLDAIVIVPVCPHTLNARPLVVPKEEVITVKTGDKLLSVAIDGSETPECIKQISIKTSANKALLAFLNDDSYYSVLRNKLHWGISPEKS